MVDMEDSGVTQKTLEVHRVLSSRSLPAAVAIQACLHRSREDVDELVRSGASVRLVKGAFAEGRKIAFTRRGEVDASYLALAERLLSREARGKGVYPIFGTHDERMIRQVQAIAQAQGWHRAEWEIEMLLGVRPELQRRLVAEGCSVRVYLPFGKNWWPYSVRRIGENPRNLGFVMRALLG